MHVTSDDSMKLFREMADNQPELPLVPSKQRRKSNYLSDGLHQVALVNCTNRNQGIAKALGLLGGLKPLLKGVKGEIVIKPNCNTDDIYPRDTCPETIRIIASSLIENGVAPNKIVVGDMSGKARSRLVRTVDEEQDAAGVRHGRTIHGTRHR